MEARVWEECDFRLGLRDKGTLEGVGSEKSQCQGCYFGHNMIEKPIKYPTNLPDRQMTEHSEGREGRRMKGRE